MSRPETPTAVPPGTSATSPEPSGLGDIIHHGLARIGVTPEVVETWLGKPCGCEERRVKLNQLSAWARRVVAGKLVGAATYLQSMISED